MGNFLLKLEDWIISQEEKLAKECKVDIDTIEKELNSLMLYKKKLESKCHQEKKDLEYLENRLHWTKAYSIKCKEFLERNYKKN